MGVIPGDEEALWWRSFLVQQFVLQHEYAMFAEVLMFWNAGLLERVEGLAGPELHFVPDVDYAGAQRAMRVLMALSGRK